MWKIVVYIIKKEFAVTNICLPKGVADHLIFFIAPGDF